MLRLGDRNGWPQSWNCRPGRISCLRNSIAILDTFVRYCLNNGLDRTALIWPTKGELLPRGHAQLLLLLITLVVQVVHSVRCVYVCTCVCVCTCECVSVCACFRNIGLTLEMTSDPSRYFTWWFTITHNLANRHSCLTPAKNEGIDIDHAGPVAGGMINQQTIFLYPYRGQCKQKYSRMQ